jgi:hypothetical protein
VLGRSGLCRPAAVRSKIRSSARSIGVRPRGWPGDADGIKRGTVQYCVIKQVRTPSYVLDNSWLRLRLRFTRHISRYRFCYVSRMRISGDACDGPLEFAISHLIILWRESQRVAFWNLEWLTYPLMVYLDCDSFENYSKTKVLNQKTKEVLKLRIFLFTSWKKTAFGKIKKKSRLK